MRTIFAHVAALVVAVCGLLPGVAHAAVSTTQPEGLPNDTVLVGSVGKQAPLLFDVFVPTRSAEGNQPYTSGPFAMQVAAAVVHRGQELTEQPFRVVARSPETKQLYTMVCKQTAPRLGECTGGAGAHVFLVSG